VANIISTEPRKLAVFVAASALVILVGEEGAVPLPLPLAET
jgi:hypothetical protein